MGRGKECRYKREKRNVMGLENRGHLEKSPWTVG